MRNPKQKKNIAISGCLLYLSYIWNARFFKLFLYNLLLVILLTCNFTYSSSIEENFK